MSALPLVRCPSCTATNAVPPNAAGAIVRCPACGANYLVPRQAFAQPAPAQPGTAARPAAAPLSAAPSLAAPPVSSPPNPTLPPMARPLSGPLPPHLAQGTVPPASPQTVQPAALSSAPAQPASAATSPAVPSRPRRSSATLLIAGLLLLFGACAAAGAALVYVVNRSATQMAHAESGSEANPGDSDSETGDPERASPAADAIDARPKGVSWTLAPRSLTRAGVRVKVMRVIYGEVHTRDASGQPTPAGPGEFVQVYMQLENRADATLHYTSWLGNQFAEEDRKVAARLFGTSGKRFPQQEFSAGQELRGHTPQATLAREERADDVIIFAAPREALGPGEKLYLELPAGAFSRKLPGGVRHETGYFRFEIPDTMFGSE